MTFYVTHHNFGGRVAGDHPTVASAIERAKSLGLEASIMSSKGDMVASWSPISGTEMLLLPKLAVVTYTSTNGKLSTRVFNGDNAWPDARSWSERIGDRLVDCDLRLVKPLPEPRQAKC